MLIMFDFISFWFSLFIVSKLLGICYFELVVSQAIVMKLHVEIQNSMWKWDQEDGLLYVEADLPTADSWKLEPFAELLKH